MIRGGSDGGYTMLCALAPKDDKVFGPGASYYGVSDLDALARDREIYAQRSPINHVDRLSAPAIFFRGAEDRIVPPNQTELFGGDTQETRRFGGLFRLRGRAASFPEG
jgi:dipeptidyl aminopeptidase/acylaminoacyl peptidase